MNKVFVVSLPRTGTTSMCKMLNILGYKSKHVPSCFYEKWVREGYTAFADTPCFSLSFIKEQSIIDESSKFIYINRDFNEWIDSIERVHLDKSYVSMMQLSGPDNLNVVRLNEIKSYGETFGFRLNYDRDIFLQKAQEHKQALIEMLSPSKLLLYDFYDGWDSLCKFLNLDRPDSNVPFLNKEKIGDSYAHSYTIET